MNLPLIDINVEGEVDLLGLEFETLSQRSVAAAIGSAELDVPENAELSIMLCDDAMIQQLNAQWRDKDKPTNVLSFPGETGDILLGDIVISMDTVAREAALENKSVEDHVTHLIVHGFLHLFGYDHETDDEAVEMESLETKILGQLGIANPYENAPQP